MIVLVGLFAGLAGAAAAGLFLRPALGGYGGWCEQWSESPGSLVGLLATLGNRVLAGIPGLGRAARSAGGFLACSEGLAVGLAILAAVCVGGWIVVGKGALLALGAVVWGLRRARIAKVRAQRRSWEIDVAGWLAVVALQVSAGRELRDALHAAREGGLAGAARELGDSLDARFRLGWDAARALEDIGRHAPDASTAAFFHGLATSLRGGAPLGPVLRREVERLRAQRRLRIAAWLEALPGRLELYRALMLGAAASPMVAVAWALVERLNSLL